MRWFEEVRIGDAVDLGTHAFTAEAIVAFARRFDPQPFHLDAEAAEQSHFGGLIASGWHTASAWMRLFVAYQRREAERRGLDEPFATLGPSPGFQALQWRRPVYAGDVIRYATAVTDKRPLASRPQWGLVTSRNEGFNGRNELAFAFTGHVFVRRQAM